MPATIAAFVFWSSEAILREGKKAAGFNDINGSGTSWPRARALRIRLLRVFAFNICLTFFLYAFRHTKHKALFARGSLNICSHGGL